LRRHASAMKLVNCLRDSPCQRYAIWTGQQRSGGRAWHLTLEPHMKPRDNADWLWHGDPVRAALLKARVPNRVQQPHRLIAVSPRAHFAQEVRFLAWKVRPRDLHLVGNHTALARFVPKHADRFDLHLPIPARQPGQAALEFMKRRRGI